jgi:transcriptional regulator with XRE-family HTH domain
MTPVSTTADIYWGIGGEYGPFHEQQTGEWAGWPDFGEVMRYFRKKARIKAKEFALTYGQSIGRTITDRQIQRMEHDNQVPADINKRKLIARLLDIPPVLFGLAVLENVTLKPHPKIAGAVTKIGQPTLTKVTVDITKYENNVRKLVMLHDTSQVQSELDQINADIQELDNLADQARGDLLYHISEILLSDYLLVASVVRDLRKFNLSHYYANQAVRVALALGDTDLIATARYVRGCTYLEWGRNGALENGVFKVQLDKINKAIRDFVNAKQAADSSEKRLHPQIIGRIDMSLSRAYTIRSLSTGGKVPTIALTLLDEAEESADCENIDDPYERHLITGSPVGFVKGEYHNSKARGLTLAGRPGAALTELIRLSGLRQGTIGRQFTRSQIWLDIVAADTFMGLEQYKEVTERASRALVGCQDINSVAKLACIVDIHGRLLQSNYKDEPDVKELGDMIHETIPNGIEQEEEQLIEEDY